MWNLAFNIRVNVFYTNLADGGWSLAWQMPTSVTLTENCASVYLNSSMVTGKGKKNENQNALFQSSINGCPREGLRLCHTS
jgi:hypothetical protein